ncbi:MAG: hypothetical protein JWN34_4072 [Bryobacterales bacterium]|nr:hypothetical protein [Bryobacterales bacterium]
MYHTQSKDCLRLYLFIAALLLAPVGATAHDIPADVAVHMFVAPRGQSLGVLIRVPMPALRDIDIPERAPGVTDLPRLQSRLPDAAQVWLANFIEIREDGQRLPRPKVEAVQLSLPSDRSFLWFPEALAHTVGPAMPPETSIVWNQLFADVLLTYPIRSATSKFAIHPRLQTLAARVLTTVRFVPPNSPERAFEFTGDPGLVTLDPGWFQAAWQFIGLGFRHILDGTDHLLFLLCLVLPLRKFRPLLVVVTAFTAAHSITLIASAFELAPSALWFPPLVETLIAVSIVYMGLENIASEKPRHHRWVLAFGFGLIHGFGFSFALKETLQFAGRHLLTSLLAFNLGVELGQLTVLAITIPLLALLFRYVVAERMGIIIVSALVVHTAWHWMLERAEVLGKYHPVWTGDGVATALQWVVGLALFLGAAWLFRNRSGGGTRREALDSQEEPAPQNR